MRFNIKNENIEYFIFLWLFSPIKKGMANNGRYERRTPATRPVRK